MGGILFIFSKLFPIIFYFTLGYLSKKFGVFDRRASDNFVRFIVVFAFPSLVIYNVYNLKFDKAFITLIVFGWIVIITALTISFLVGKFILNLNRKTLASFMLLASFGNTSFLGFPFQIAFLGEEGLKFAVVFDQLASFLPVSLISPIIIAYGKGDKIKKFNIRKIVTFPPFIALNLGFLIKFLNITIPQFILDALLMLGSVVIPLALFSIGINFKLSHFTDRKKELALVLLIKMILIPIIFMFLVLHLMNIPLDINTKAFFIEILMPPMVLVSIFIIEQKLDEELAIASVGIGIIFSFISVPILFWFMNNMFG